VNDAAADEPMGAMAKAGLKEASRVGEKYELDGHEGWNVVCTLCDPHPDGLPIAFAYRVSKTHVRFVYLPDPTFTFDAYNTDFRKTIGGKPNKKLTWEYALFDFARFLEGWYSI
jgi:hypothetical protein